MLDALHGNMAMKQTETLAVRKVAKSFVNYPGEP